MKSWNGRNAKKFYNKKAAPDTKPPAENGDREKDSKPRPKQKAKAAAAKPKAKSWFNQVVLFFGIAVGQTGVPTKRLHNFVAVEILNYMFSSTCISSFCWWLVKHSSISSWSFRHGCGFHHNLWLWYGGFAKTNVVESCAMIDEFRICLG